MDGWKENLGWLAGRQMERDFWIRLEDAWDKSGRLSSGAGMRFGYALLFVR